MKTFPEIESDWNEKIGSEISPYLQYQEIKGILDKLYDAGEGEEGGGKE